MADAPLACSGGSRDGVGSSRAVATTGRVARVAVVEVAMDVRVTVLLEAEGATEVELSRLVEREAANVRGAIVARVERAGWQKTEVSAGWLDESREAFVTDVTAAESCAPARLKVER